MTIKELLAEYETRYLVGIIDQARSRSCIKALLSVLTGQVNKLTRQALLDYRAKRRSLGLADNSINKELKTLGSAINWGNGERLCSIEIKMPKTREVIRAESLSVEQVQSLINHCEDLRGKCYIALLFATAQRKSAVQKLKRSQIINGIIEFDQDGYSMAARRKPRARTPLTEEIEGVLGKLESAYPGASYVLPGDGGFGWCKKLDRMFVKAAQSAGIKASAHTIRHSSATVAIGNGVSLYEVSCMLAHGSVATTQKIYIHRQPEHSRNAVTGLGRAIKV